MSSIVAISSVCDSAVVAGNRTKNTNGQLNSAHKAKRQLTKKPITRIAYAHIKTQTKDQEAKKRQQSNIGSNKSTKQTGIQSKIVRNSILTQAIVNICQPHKSSTSGVSRCYSLICSISRYIYTLTHTRCASERTHVSVSVQHFSSLTMATAECVCAINGTNHR